MGLGWGHDLFTPGGRVGIGPLKRKACPERTGTCTERIGTRKKAALRPIGRGIGTIVGNRLDAGFTTLLHGKERILENEGLFGTYRNVHGTYRNV